MTKKIYTCLLLLFTAGFVGAQTVDTVLYEGFQGDPFPLMALTPSGNNATWVNYDQDGIPCITGQEADKRWNSKEFYYLPLDSLTGEVNFCAGSYSFLEGSALGNRNWLITPPIAIGNNTYTLHWRSAPSQLPRYMDGYVVLGAEASNLVSAFTDTLFQAASMASITGNGQSLNLANFSFTPGYIHANSMTLPQYFTPSSNNTLAFGRLEPHSVSLAGFGGKTMYFAFLHNSDDDDRIAIDDILITRTSTVGTDDQALNDLRFVTYPNPVDNYMDVMFRHVTAQDVSVIVTDAAGKEVMDLQKGKLSEGEQYLRLDLQSLIAGMYVMTFRSGETTISKIFRKR